MSVVKYLKLDEERSAAVSNGAEWQLRYGREEDIIKNRLSIAELVSTLNYLLARDITTKQAIKTLRDIRNENFRSGGCEVNNTLSKPAQEAAVLKADDSEVGLTISGQEGQKRYEFADGTVLHDSDIYPAQDDQKALVRELDVALNGEAGAAKQASLCDIVAQVQSQNWKLVRQSQEPSAEDVVLRLINALENSGGKGVYISKEEAQKTITLLRKLGKPAQEAGEVVEWISVDTPPDRDRNVYIAYWSEDEECPEWSAYKVTAPLFSYGNSGWHYLNEERGEYEWRGDMIDKAIKENSMWKYAERKPLPPPPPNSKENDSE